MKIFSTTAICISLGFTSHGQDCTPVTDIDGNMYPVVQIGTQCWMAENLRTSHYRDGSEIPNITDGFEWDGYATGAWCNYDNDPANDAVYGKLYNWRAVFTGLLCPLGWHVANETEWGILIDYLGGGQEAGGKMKSIGTMDDGNGLWNAPNAGATNESGFSAVPGGRRGMIGLGGFDGLSSRALFWNAIGNAQFSQWVWGLSSENTNTSGGAMPNPFSLGNCVRCMQDGSGTGMTEQGSELFTLVPNPTCGIVTLSFTRGSQPQRTTLLDATGRMVEVLRTNTSNTITFDLSGFEDGLYMVQVLFADGTLTTQRVIKE